MYGLLLKNLQEYVIKTFGAQKWKEVMESLKIDQDSFMVMESYPEGQLVKMAKKAMQVVNTKDQEFYEGMGVYFVELTSAHGFDSTLSHLGRYLRDFILNLDNLHDYLKFTFPKMKAPSFFVVGETEQGISMQYRSKRRGFHYYVQGQVKELAKKLFAIKNLDIKLLKQEVIFDTVVCSFELKFDNVAYKNWLDNVAQRRDASLPIKAATIFEMFPFCILFTTELVVTCIGVALREVIPGIVGKKITAYFELVKPLIEFKFDVIQSRSNNVFELATQEEVDKLGATSRSSANGKFSDEINLEEDVDKTLHIKGQMIFMPEWNQMLFLACPIMKDLNSLIWCGLFVNDLSMHDYSRDTLLATSQEQIEMRMALSAAESKASTLNAQLKKLDEIMKKTDELLYQMIPKSVAERLRRGESPMDTCEVFDLVTMLFSDIVGFTTICSRIQPQEVVMFLNNLYTLFDFLVDQNQVYKVETIGDAYLIVSGCPVKTMSHAVKICDMAFDMMDGIRMLKDPGTGKDVEMRIGCHSGAVVAGVVGLKMPRYCLFGLNVGLTEKFESNSKPMRIHVSDPCKQLLPAQYKLEERTAEAEPELAKKVGGHKSYFLNSKDGRKPLQEAVIRALMPTQTESGNLGNFKKDSKKDNAQDSQVPPAGQKTEDGSKNVNKETSKQASPEEPPQANDRPRSNPKTAPNGRAESAREPDNDQNGLKPAFPGDRRFSEVHSQCCNGFNHSGVCLIL